MILLYRIYKFYEKAKDRSVEREYNKINSVPLIICSILTIIIVYFTSGYFRYMAVAIASGSMSSKIEKGDVVIVKKMSDKYDTIKVGDIIAYKYGEAIIVHRVDKRIAVDGKYYFYTKGDANPKIDDYAVKENMIIGKVSIKIPYIGLPTVWLSEI